MIICRFYDSIVKMNQTLASPQRRRGRNFQKAKKLFFIQFCLSVQREKCNKNLWFVLTRTQTPPCIHKNRQLFHKYMQPLNAKMVDELDWINGSVCVCVCGWLVEGLWLDIQRNICINNFWYTFRGQLVCIVLPKLRLFSCLLTNTLLAICRSMSGMNDLAYLLVALAGTVITLKVIFEIYVGKENLQIMSLHSSHKY